ncbi:amidohydrolase family protein, partial [Nonomuraea sp. NPDC049784]|uniref:metal-dependent hydrolase family protein n=1 Tax=Nonomuraea sp. NPDC049784 TaxID=3154361 RepID=UPI00340AE70B
GCPVCEASTPARRLTAARRENLRPSGRGGVQKAEQNLRTSLNLGVTTVRDAGGADLGVKQAVADGLIDGSDLVIAVTPLSQTGGHVDGWTVHGEVHSLLVPHPGRPHTVVDGPDQMRLRVREIIRAGADVIKICTSGGVMSPRDDPRHPQFSEEELAVCVSEAAASGIGVMAHAQGTPGIRNAVLAGVRSIEHGIFLDDECIDLMLARGTWLVPTLLAPVALIRMIEAGTRLPQAVVDKAHSVAGTHMDAVRRAVDAGVKIAMGTDSGVFPHGLTPEELQLMVEAGMSPSRALAAATSSGADLLGLGELTGRITPGLRADMVTVDGDPYDFGTHAQRVRHVIKGGRIVRSRLAAA